MNILGISCYYHDSAAALIVDGKPVAACQEERFSRQKNDAVFPTQSINYCLNHAKVSLHDLDAVVFYEKPILKLDRQIDAYLEKVPFRAEAFVDTFAESMQKTIFLRNNLIRSLKLIDPLFSENQLLFSEHHLSHAASAFFPSPFENAIVLTIDGLGERATTGVFIGEGGGLLPQKEIHFPNSLGLFYSSLTAFCGFKVNSGEYKLMGLAPYGQPRFKKRLLDEVLLLKPDGSYQLNSSYFDFSSVKQMHTGKLCELFSTSPRPPETEITQLYMDIAASTQAALDEAMLHLTQSLFKEFKLPSLCLSGGVALNCVSNSKILKTGYFKDIWIQPAAGDAGGALGAALAAHSLHFQAPRFRYANNDSMSGAYLGPSYSSEVIRSSLRDFDLQFELLDESELLSRTCESLTLGAAVGWFQGRMEFGPRALGSRSILADPRPAEMQKKLNLKIKFRESFRPFAPVVLQEEAREWFPDLQESSPYMLFTSNVQTKFGSSIPAVTHLDNSARVQTVSSELNPRLHKLLQLFKDKTEVPILVNTSFNVRGEPIVESPEDAILCFLKTDLDLLVIGDFLLEKNKNLHKLIPREEPKTLD